MMMLKLLGNATNKRLLSNYCSSCFIVGATPTAIPPTPPYRSWKVAGEATQSSPGTLLNALHVFECPDQLGIVAKLSECIASRGGNILNVDVFVTQHERVFYSRSEFVYDHLQWPRAVMDEDFLKLAKMFNAQKSIVRVAEIDPKFRITVLASGQDHCLVDLLHGWQQGKLPVEITNVISNHSRVPNTHVIRFLERHGIPYHYLPTSKENKREEEILSLVGDTDFLVLARYMQVDRISHRDSLLSFAQKSENLEKQCLAKAIKYYCEHRVLRYQNNKTIVFD